MASLRHLPLPSVEEEKGNGWDETIGEWKRHVSDERPSLCPHAVAHGCWVLGVPCHSSGAAAADEQDWIQWRTSLAPHRVGRVASTADGSLLVASTDGGTVSLLRGRDGQVLATRRVAAASSSSSSSQGLQRPADVTFVPNSYTTTTTNNPNKDDHVLMIVSSTSTAAADTGRSSSSSSSSNVILVSNMDGARLNDENMETVAQAARNMSIEALELEGDVETIQGCFLRPGVMRLAASTAEGSVAIYDYSLQEKKSVRIQESIQEARVFHTNMKLQPHGVDHPFLVLCGTSKTSSSELQICWYDLVHLTLACEYSLPSSLEDRPRLLSFAAVPSCSDDSALAVAVALKPSRQDACDGTVHIIQVVVEETMGLAVLSRPHCVYKVQLTPPASNLSSALEAVDLAPLRSKLDGPYSFRCILRYGAESFHCSEFVTGLDRLGGSMVGRLRLLLQRELYDEADEIIASQGLDVLAASDKFAQFHSSEVALRRLQRILCSSNVTSDKQMMAQAQECLRRLTAGAVSRGHVGLEHLLEAADSIASWPNRADRHLTVAEFSMALSAMVAATASAIESAPPSQLKPLEQKKAELEQRQAAIKCVEELMQSSCSTGEIKLDSPFSSVQSPSDLFSTLMREGYFSMAEVFWRTHWSRELSSETLASGILIQPPSRDPRAYATLLKDAAIPSLKITHEAVPIIRTWACQTANSLDEDETGELGLQSSIFLLETVLGALQKLNLQVHSSFASFSPFVERRDRTSRVSPRSASTLHSSTSPDYSFGPFASSPTNSIAQHSFSSSGSLAQNEYERPSPTILELGSLKSGAMKSRLRSLSTGAPTRFNNENDDDDDEYDNEECVETKLRYAKQLQQARRLGLPTEKLRLRQYSRAGGAEHVARELIRLHSTATSDHESRYAELTCKVRPFCEEACVSFDEALEKYTSALCDSKHTSERSILESASIARCCTSYSIKCKVSLTVLRAALLCGKCPPCLSELSKDAIEWAAGDSPARSELEEATRLLVIDEIVRRYCGDGARELFRVENPRHAERLLDFVCRHIRSASVVQDALALCDAFSHLSKEEAGILLLERSLEACEPDLCLSMLSQLNELNLDLAHAVGERAVSYCGHALDEAFEIAAQNLNNQRTKQHQKKSIAVCRAACMIIEALQIQSASAPTSRLLSIEKGCFTLADLYSTFKRMLQIQTHHGVFTCFSDMMSPEGARTVAGPLLYPAVCAFIGKETDKVETKFAEARNVCSLIVGTDQRKLHAVWCSVVGQATEKLVKETEDGSCIEFLQASGVLDASQTEESTRIILAVALALCRRASLGVFAENQNLDPLHKMKDIVYASSLAIDVALVDCPDNLIESVVSLGLLTDTVSQVLQKADEGIGERLDELRMAQGEEAIRRRRHFSETAEKPFASLFDSNCSRKVLHPSWYVGDGLLLSPFEALSRSIVFCKDLLDLRLATANQLEDRSGPNLTGSYWLLRFLSERGAHTAALRVLAVSTVSAISSTASLDKAAQMDGFRATYLETLKNLSERSLGGSGSGITSDTIDSQLAVSFLLAMHSKMAFQIYKASLPAAIAKRAFTRVVTLSNIGVTAGGGDPERPPHHMAPPVSWKNQSMFAMQCANLSSKARWWNVLKKYKVDFDPSRFENKGSTQPAEDDGSKAGETTRGPSAYIASLVPSLICNASSVLKSGDRVRSLAARFVQSFGLDPHLADQKHVEFLLSCPPQTSANMGPMPRVETSLLQMNSPGGKLDIRNDIKCCQRMAKQSLNQIPSAMKRSAVLRRCVTALERSAACDRDYERHRIVLGLYHKELSAVVAQDPTIRNLDSAPFEEELESIERRRDALEILSSFFQGEQAKSRPPFPKFFTPLPVPFKMEVSIQHKQYRVVGPFSEEFDPLGPLQAFMCGCSDASTITALSPLSIPLGLPQGYIHARFLIERFRKAALQEQSLLPSFEIDVIPVLKRLRSQRDQRDLAEWCAHRYKDQDSQKLKLIDYALESAMKASSEIEQQIHFHPNDNDNILKEQEEQALEAVKRISATKSALSVKTEVGLILQSNLFGTPDQYLTVKQMFVDLTERLQSNFWDKTDSSPEKFVEVLLTEASMIAASESLRDDSSFSMDHFRHMASTVHQACKGIAEQYSHVHCGQICRFLARRWLVHGDESLHSLARQDGHVANAEGAHAKKANISLAEMEVCDDTMNFVMDLHNLGEAGAVWSDDVGSSVEKNPKSETVTAEEEPSALALNGSFREASEFACTRVSLRIAFVMSFADGYHTSRKAKDSNNENLEPNTGTNAAHRAKSKMKRSGLLSRITGSETSRHGNIIQHARELLRIVFAQGTNTVASTDSSLSFMSTDTETDDTGKQRKTLTFAMRYRALRTAAVLCPQEALERVVKEEGYLSKENGEKNCTLKQCTFGSFLAKEIEEMGLPLPHSDLVQLSTMHFPSYARALWRHHRDGRNGRLLLLLLELDSKEDTISDSTLTISLLSDMTKAMLPRTLLLGCECIALNLKTGHARMKHLVDRGADSVSSAILTVAKLMLSEFNRKLATESSTEELRDGLPSLRRLGKMIEDMSDTKDGQSQLSTFVEVLFGLLEACKLADVTVALAEITLSAVCCLKDREQRRCVLDKLAVLPGGQTALATRRIGVASLDTTASKEKVISTVFHDTEMGYTPRICSTAKDLR